MDILQDFIKSLAKEEIKSYKLFSKRTHDFLNRKDIELFDSIKKNINESDNYHCKIIYKNSKPDTKYYRLKNKITDDLGTVLTNLNHRKSEIDGLHLLSLAKLFSAKKQNSLALHYLKLAERKTIEREDYSLLESIYEQMIRLSLQTTEISPSEIIEKRHENSLRLNLLRDLENNLAILSHEVKTTQNLVPKKAMKDWLTQTLKNTIASPYVKNSPQLQIKTFQNLSRVLLLLKDFSSLEDYLKTCLIEFEESGLFNKNTHEIKLQLLVYLCNASFELGNHQQSLKYANILNESLIEYDKLFYSQYLFYYYNILVTNYFKTNLTKAIDILLEAQQQTIIKNNPTYYFYVLSNLTLSYFESKKHKLASKLFSQIYISQSYNAFETAFKLKLFVFELVNRLEMGDFDVCEKQLSQIEKTLEDVDDLESLKQETEFLNIITLFLKQEEKRWRPLRTSIQSFIKTYPSGDTQSGLIEYSSWLSSKI